MQPVPASQAQDKPSSSPSVDAAQLLGRHLQSHAGSKTSFKPAASSFAASAADTAAAMSSTLRQASHVFDSAESQVLPLEPTLLWADISALSYYLLTTSFINLAHKHQDCMLCWSHNLPAVLSDYMHVVSAIRMLPASYHVQGCSLYVKPHSGYCFASRCCVLQAHVGICCALVCQCRMMVNICIPCRCQQLQSAEPHAGQTAPQQALTSFWTPCKKRQWQLRLSSS